MSHEPRKPKKEPLPQDREIIQVYLAAITESERSHYVALWLREHLARFEELGVSQAEIVNAGVAAAFQMAIGELGSVAAARWFREIADAVEFDLSEAGPPIPRRLVN